MRIVLEEYYIICCYVHSEWAVRLVWLIDEQISNQSEAVHVVQVQIMADWIGYDQKVLIDG